MDLPKSVSIEIEVARTRKQINQSELEYKLLSFISTLTPFAKEQVINCSQEVSFDLAEYVESISIDNNFKVPIEKESIKFYFYKNYERGPEIETFETMDENGEEIPASNHWLLPSREFVGLWESLLYEDGLKENLLKFAETAMIFSNLNVNTNIIACNRMVLLHGPPGTGKTSLCKAIAQKLSIRLLSMYKHTHLVEINSHSLFSKWFSESGKLVMKLFSKIKEIVAQPKSLVCVLIDEVESIAYCRESVSGSEPRDALRVVNAVLTQLDQIKNYSNVLIFTTSNLTSTIDLAFIDRADIKQYIGFPTVKAIYEIYSSAIKELLRVGLITEGEFIPYDCIDLPTKSIDDNLNMSIKLLKVSEDSLGLSGRTLRKIPFLAHAYFIKSDKTSLENFIASMAAAVKRNKCDQKLLNNTEC